MTTPAIEGPRRTPAPSTVKTYSQAIADEWDSYVRAAPLATFCHLAGWGRVIQRTWQHRPHHLYAEREGALVGVLPLFQVRSLFGSMLVSTPNAIYGGPLADDAETRRALIGAAKRMATDLQVDYLELRETWDSDESVADPDLKPKQLYVTFEHSIPADETALLASVPGKIRNMIRKGQKYGLTSEVGGVELLDEFYEVFATNMRNLGTPVFPKRLFAEFLRAFPDSCDILIVRHLGRLSAATLNFYFRDTVLPHYASANRDFYYTGVSNFLFWEVMRRASARGYTRFDFGRSKLNSGSCNFKRTWKMKERALPYKYFLVRATGVPNLNPTNANFQLLIRAWKHLPVPVTRFLGPMIVRHIP